MSHNEKLSGMNTSDMSEKAQAAIGRRDQAHRENVSTR